MSLNLVKFAWKQFIRTCEGSDQVNVFIFKLSKVKYSFLVKIVGYFVQKDWRVTKLLQFH